MAGGSAVPAVGWHWLHILWHDSRRAWKAKVHVVSLLGYIHVLLRCTFQYPTQYRTTSSSQVKRCPAALQPSRRFSNQFKQQVSLHIYRHNAHPHLIGNVVPEAVDTRCVGTSAQPKCRGCRVIRGPVMKDAEVADIQIVNADWSVLSVNVP